jgi:hypothetical protein
MRLAFSVRLPGVLAAVLLLAACSGEEYGLKEPEVQRGLAIRDAGLDPLDPEPLTRPIAWVDARDADSVVVHYAFVGDDSVVAELALLPVSDEDPSGFVRWEIELPPRAAEESLDYRFEALTGAGTAGLGPFRVSPTPFTIDFPWPGWPDPAYNWPTRGDISRVLDGAEDEATLAPAFPFDVIREPIWKTMREATIMANNAGVREGIGIEHDGQAWFLPFAVMLWNEVANLTFGDIRSGISYCPLTDTILHFDSGFEPGNLPKWHNWAPAGLFNSNLSVGIEGLAAGQSSAFNQMIGYAFLGPDAGERLVPRPAVLVDINLWQRLHPNTLVLEGDPETVREFDYIRRPNPYEEYWKTEEIRAPVARTDDRFHPKKRVFGVVFPDDPLVLPIERRQDFIHHARISGLDVVILHTNRMAIALHAKHPLTGEPLRLSRSRATWRETPLFEDDSADPSLWTLEGVAISGPAKGTRLGWIPSMSSFWFAWYAMYPEARFELPEIVHQR